MCLAGGVSQDAVEASRVGSDRIGPHRRISGGHLNICRVDVLSLLDVGFGIGSSARPAPRTFRAGQDQDLWV